MDDPVAMMNKISKDTMTLAHKISRDWETSKNQRFGVYERNSGRLIGAFCLSRESERVPKELVFKNPNISSDPGMQKILQQLEETESTLK